MPSVGTVTLYAIAASVVVFLVLPTALVVPMSFNGGHYLSFPPESWSLKWYGHYFQDREWMRATAFSLEIAVLTMITATVIGTMAAFALVRGEVGRFGWVNTVSLAPMIVPNIIAAVAMYLVFARLRLTGTVPGFVLAHTTLAIPYVMLTVSAALYRVDPALEMAALNLGASGVAAFWHVTLPLILPAVQVAGVFAFIVSLDEAVISFFLSSATGTTLTRKLFEDIDYSLSPVVAVVSTLLVLLPLIVLGGVAFVRRTARMKERPISSVSDEPRP